MKELGLSLLIQLSRITNTVHGNTSRMLIKYDLTLSQFGVLEALYHKGDMTVGQVQRKILSTTGTMPVIVKNLEKRGLITRTISPEDRRQVILSITEEGRQLIEQAFPENKEMIVDYFSVLTIEEQEQLFKLLQKTIHERRDEHE